MKMAGYLEHIKQLREQRSLLLRTCLRKEASRCLDILLEKDFNFKRLYLFGSTVEDGTLHSWSDIDLAVEGLRSDLYLKLYALLLKEARFPVDIKPYEELDKSIRERIKKKGVILYEKK